MKCTMKVLGECMIAWNTVRMLASFDRAKELLAVVPNQGLNVPPTYCFMGTGNLCNSMEGYEMKTCTRFVLLVVRVGRVV